MSIRKLPDAVVNRIAAGEVVVRPSNAVKELIENSLDAGARNIVIIIGNGGLMSIQVIDDGRGIAVKDHSLVCERFATSKLVSADDLVAGNVSSFGFRGEALASMSMVGHVTVYSKCVDDGGEWGYESRYSCGRLLEGYPAQVAFNGKSGTRIIVEDLFFDNPVRKRGFKQPSAEYKRMLELVSRFAVMYPDIGFKIRKTESSSFDLVEESDVNASRKSRIESLFAVQDSIHVVLDELEELPEPLKSCEIIISNPLSHVTSVRSPSLSSTAIVVVNNRLVESLNIIKLIETEVSSQTQTRLRFIFLNICIESSQIDVNVCPTKSRVVFANQSKVDRWIVDKLLDKLNDSKRTKLVKLNKIRFDPVVPVQDSIKRQFEPIATTQPFKIHTCPKQNVFVPSLQPSQEVFISLTQVDHPPHVEKLEDSPVAETDSELKQFCRQISFSDQEYMLNPRDFVWVGEIGEGFALCQFNSRLCICNVRHTFLTLVSRFLIRTDFSLCEIDAVSTNLENVPKWICELISGGENKVERFPMIRKSDYIDADKINVVISQVSTLDGSISIENIKRVSLILSEFIFEAEFGSNYSLAWNEVIRNKSFHDSSLISGQDNLELLARDQRKNFFFREVISLKEIYKEFERC